MLYMLKLFLICDLFFVGVVLAQNAEIYKFNLGKFECTVISDGSGYLGLYEFYPQISNNTLDQNRDLFHYPDDWQTYFNALLCDTGDSLVLLDAGSENRFLPGDTGRLQKNLEEAGYTPQDIREIIVEHGHVDHYGGLISNATNEVLFPNARVWIPDEDYVFYTNESNREAPYFEDFNLIFGVLEDAGIQVERFLPGELIEGFEALDLSGHSPGHTVIKVSSEGKNLYYVGDVLFNEVTVANPEWPSGYDMEPENAVESRLKLLQTVTDENALVQIYHINFPGLGFVEETGGGSYRWTPKQYEF